jgi:hypothetical protein
VYPLARYQPLLAVVEYTLQSAWTSDNDGNSPGTGSATATAITAAAGIKSTNFILSIGAQKTDGGQRVTREDKKNGKK